MSRANEATHVGEWGLIVTQREALIDICIRRDANLQLWRARCSCRARRDLDCKAILDTFTGRNILCTCKAQPKCQACNHPMRIGERWHQQAKLPMWYCGKCQTKNQLMVGTLVLDVALPLNQDQRTSTDASRTLVRVWTTRLWRSKHPWHKSLTFNKVAGQASSEVTTDWIEQHNAKVSTMPLVARGVTIATAVTPHKASKRRASGRYPPGHDGTPARKQLCLQAKRGMPSPTPSDQALVDMLESVESSQEQTAKLVSATEQSAKSNHGSDAAIAAEAEAFEASQPTATNPTSSSITTTVVAEPTPSASASPTPSDQALAEMLELVESSQAPTGASNNTPGIDRDSDAESDSALLAEVEALEASQPCVMKKTDEYDKADNNDAHESCRQQQKHGLAADQPQVVGFKGYAAQNWLPTLDGLSSGDEDDDEDDDDCDTDVIDD
eukprot:TRINITY_DN14410_c0_g1_i1.p1 TRINITY_DN14410_c0_g1~~TRINITY_DN14410_c0_g1_i1.p1  ORF type:complete len:441 (+),score=88.34 TRINITY_DN14410_c0_g1_i1:56-1378(+)